MVIINIYLSTGVEKELEMVPCGFCLCVGKFVLH